MYVLCNYCNHMCCAEFLATVPKLSVQAFGESGPMGWIKDFQNEFLKESGLKVQNYEQGYSSSVAGISAGDWAIEFPRAMAPKIHVSPLRLHCYCL